MYGDRGSLANTGGTIGFLGGTAAFQWTVALVFALVLAGALLYRTATRSKRYEG